MDWNKKRLAENRLRGSLVDGKRDKLSNDTDNRTPFESDFGRVIFSPACRRLHDKTQVFPLTTDDNIHSRLTHSLEVMNIGLSFAIYLSGNKVFLKKTGLSQIEILRKISPILKTACLVHDIGNPPFGHFGEVVVQDYFTRLFTSLEEQDRSNILSKYILDGINDTDYILKKERKKDNVKELNTDRLNFIKTELDKFLANDSLKFDYEQFDGNAEGFRILTKLQYTGDLFGLNLTFATLASTLKYPNIGGKETGDAIEKHKHGVFFTEKKYLDKIMKTCDLVHNDREYFRHPLSYLMEAADSICYLIMDIEDAIQKDWITLNEVVSNLKESKSFQKIEANLRQTSGDNTYLKKKWVNLRTTLLTHLMEVATLNFVDKLDFIEKGKYKSELIEDGDDVAKVLKELSKQKILSKREIISLEVTGEAVITNILNAYIKYFFHVSKAFRDHGKSLISKSIFMTVLHEHKEEYGDNDAFKSKYGSYEDFEKLSQQFDIADFTVEERFRLIRDFVACMTDKFALHHIQRLNGQKL